jgi:putative SOS response-associated peptidase YedK
MCGRFVRKCSLNEITDEFEILEIQWAWEPSYNIAPGQNVAGILNEGGRTLVPLRWGLIPWWAKDQSIGYKMINARAESVGQKRSFSRAIKTQRCLIVADGFYEWQQVEKKKYPVYIKLRSGKPFGLAGIYDRWKSGDGAVITSCTIITTVPNEVVKPLHNRMPVIIERDERTLWLDKNVTEIAEIMPLLKPYPSGEMEAYQVSTKVNSPKFNQPECIKPVSSTGKVSPGLFNST